MTKPNRPMERYGARLAEVYRQRMKRNMRVSATILICLAVVLVGCTVQQLETPHTISETEARQRATDHVNAEFKGYVWKTTPGSPTFRTMSPEDWFVVKVEETRILVKRGGRNG